MQGMFIIREKKMAMETVNPDDLSLDSEQRLLGRRYTGFIGFCIMLVQVGTKMQLAQ